MTAVDNGHQPGAPLPATVWQGHLVDEHQAPAPAPVPVDAVEDFDAFWAEHRARERRPRARIRGVEVLVPIDVPLAFEDLLTTLGSSSKREDVERMLAMLFPAGVLDRWKAAGMSGRELRVVLAWGMSNAAGKRIDFAQAVELVAKAEAKDAEQVARQHATGGITYRGGEQGKAPAGNRAARRRKKARKGS